ncbi:MAG: transporter substrate-binding domain-containing protein [Chloroflexi bacterium]|nr:transporter substrate-binding domain-containing protein [Chloroflexota bacterium]
MCTARGIVRLLGSLLLALGVVSCASAPPPSSKPAADVKPAAAAPPTFPADSYMAKIVQRGKLSAGVRFDVPLMSFQNPKTGQMEGFESDFAREIAKGLFGDPTKIEFKQITTPTRIPLLQEGVVDVVIATLTITKTRMEQIDFSHVYLMTGHGAMVANDSPLQKLEELAGKSIIVVKGGTVEKNLRATFPTSNLVLLENDGDSFQALQSKRGDAWVADENNIRAFQASRGASSGYRLLPGSLAAENLGLGMQKGHPEFVEFVNKIVSDSKTNGRWKALWKANQGDPVPEPPADAPTIILP